MGRRRVLNPIGWRVPFRKPWSRLTGGMFVLVFGFALFWPPQKDVRLALLGDIMLGRGVSAAWETSTTGNPLALLAEGLNSADLAFANLESPLTGLPLLEPAGYDLRADPSAASALAKSGLDVVSLANNHSLDSGLQGLQDTRAALAAVGLRGVSSHDPTLRLNLDGIELVVLAYDGVTQPLDLSAITAAVSREKSHGAVVMVSLHWGGEFRPAADLAQRSAARALAQAGADLIWGHHPHVLQPVEWLERPEPQRPCLVVYSLGNALFDQAAPPDARWGALLVASLDALGVKTIELHPFEIDPFAGVLKPSSPVTATKIRERLKIP